MARKLLQALDAERILEGAENRPAVVQGIEASDWGGLILGNLGLLQAQTATVETAVATIDAQLGELVELKGRVVDFARGLATILPGLGTISGLLENLGERATEQGSILDAIADGVTSLLAEPQYDRALVLSMLREAYSTLAFEIEYILNRGSYGRARQALLTMNQAIGMIDAGA